MTRRWFLVEAGFLKLSHELALSLFDVPKKAIVEHIDGILNANNNNNKGASVLFLVGGFSESRVIQQAVDELLSKRSKPDGKAAAEVAGVDVKSKGLVGCCRCGVLPLNPGLCVMNGAVHYGMNPQLVSERIAKKSFGVQVSQSWDEKRMGSRSKEYRVYNGKHEAFCSAVFSTFCEVGEVLSVDHKVTKTYHPGADRQQVVTLTIVETPKKNVLFTDDLSCTKLGQVSLLIPLPQKTPTAATPAAAAAAASPTAADDFGLDRDIEVSFCFGSTEISITANESSSGNKLDCFVDCLDFDLGGRGFLSKHPPVFKGTLESLATPLPFHIFPVLRINNGFFCFRVDRAY